jgi:hypothetical protein
MPLRAVLKRLLRDTEHPPIVMATLEIAGREGAAPVSVTVPLSAEEADWLDHEGLVASGNADPPQVELVVRPVGGPARRRLPVDRQVVARDFNVDGHEGTIRASMYEDGKVGEIFISLTKMGAPLHGLLETISILMSIALQYGAPLDVIASKLTGLRFEPLGRTFDKEFPTVLSISDWVGCWLTSRFVQPVTPFIPASTTTAAPASASAPAPTVPTAAPARQFLRVASR